MVIVKIQILSDLHLEFKPIILSGSEADVIVLPAGVLLMKCGRSWVY